jgi:hypothetical protein
MLPPYPDWELRYHDEFLQSRDTTTISTKNPIGDQKETVYSYRVTTAITKPQPSDNYMAREPQSAREQPPVWLAPMLTRIREDGIAMRA